MPAPERLLNPQVIAGEVLRNILFFGLYGRLLDQLADWGYDDRTFNHCIPWGYNWTKSIPILAELLSDELNQKLEALGEKDRIVLLGHSMGGLVCTYALECLEATAQRNAWRDRVKLLITFGTPYYGAPEALKNAFGLENVPGIGKKQCHALMADPRFPSAYQLLPHLAANASWSHKPPLSPLSDYSHLAPSGLSLGPENLRSALDFQDAMTKAQKSPATRKFNFCGNALETAWGAMSDAKKPTKFTLLSGRHGDGTVPSWSGRQNPNVQFAPLGTTHRKTFDDFDLLEVLKQLLSEELTPGGPGGPGGKIHAAHDDGRSLSVALAKDAAPVGTDDVVVYLLKRPSSNRAYFAWVDLGLSITLEDARNVITRNFPLEPAESVLVGSNVDMPIALHIRPPRQAGIYALAAWSGEGEARTHDVNTNSVSHFLYFNEEAEKGGGHHQVPPRPPSLEKNWRSGAR